jgi:AraC family transcriptional regulator
MTPNDTARDAYRARLLKVVAYVDANLDDELSLDVLAGVAAFSKFHFHRQFAAVFGLSVFEVVQLCRLKRASYDLAFRARGVLDVALDAGYESPESFARAFKKRFGQTPSEWRAEPDWIAWHTATTPLHDMRREIMSHAPAARPVAIVAFPETRVAVLEHHGDPRRLNDTIRTFIAWRREHRLSPQTSATFNLLYADPETTPPEEYRLDLCAAVKGSVPANDVGIVERMIPGGRCATLRLVGPDDGVGAILDRLYREWLPGSGEELRDFPPFLQRVSLYPEVPEHEAVVDIFLPLK